MFLVQVLMVLSVFAVFTIYYNKTLPFPHRDIHKHTWTSPDSVTHNQISYPDRQKMTFIYIRCPFP
jgi:hypothetical protein